LGEPLIALLTVAEDVFSKCLKLSTVQLDADMIQFQADGSATAKARRPSTKNVIADTVARGGDDCTCLNDLSALGVGLSCADALYKFSFTLHHRVRPIG